MANEKNDDIPSLTLEVLKDMRADMRGTNERLDNLTGEVRAMGADIRLLNNKVDILTNRVDTLTGRFDHFLEYGGEAHRSLDRRVTELETRVYKRGRSAR